MNAGLIAQIIIVLELPPKAFYRIRVKALLRNGTTSLDRLPPALSARIEMHCPSIVKLRLIAAPSLSLSPTAPVYPDFSEPARSTKFITENFS